MSDAMDAIKNRRRKAAGRPGGTAQTANTPPNEPASSMTQVMTRRNPALFDPAEMPIVIETGGHVPPADHSEFYMVAEIEGIEHIVPEGCRTPIARTLWRRGQHVRRDVYLTYLKTIDRDPPSPADDGKPQE